MSRKNKVPRDEEKIGFIGLGNMGGALAGASLILEQWF